MKSIAAVAAVLVAVVSLLLVAGLPSPGKKQSRPEDVDCLFSPRIEKIPLPPITYHLKKKGIQPMTTLSTE